MTAGASTISQPAHRNFDLWKHQLEAYDFVCRHDAAMLAMVMGSGKSAVVATQIANESSGPSLILCPHSVLDVWPREITKHADGLHCLRLKNGSTVKKVEQAIKFLTRDSLGIVIANYETFRQRPFAEFAQSMVWDRIILDESHRVKAPQGKTSKLIGKLAFKGRRRLCLTGTPMPHSPLDIYGQYRFLDRNIFGTSYTRFRARYAITHQMFPSKVLDWINEDERDEKFHSIAYCVGEEVLDLPDEINEVRSFELGRKAMAAYRELERELIAFIGDAGVVTVANALVKLLRLQQITSGAIAPDRSDELMQVDSAKEKMLADLLEDLEDEQVIVFCRFHYDLDVVKRVTKNLGRRYGEISGRSKDGLNNQAELSKDCCVVGAQIQSSSTGIDLTASAFAIYYSMGFSLGDYLQSKKRLLRPGQARPVRFYYLIAEKTVDAMIYRALTKRKDFVESIVFDYRKGQHA